MLIASDQIDPKNISLKGPVEKLASFRSTKRQHFPLHSSERFTSCILAYYPGIWGTGALPGKRQSALTQEMVLHIKLEKDY